MSNREASGGGAIGARLSVMMFLQFFISGEHGSVSITGWLNATGISGITGWVYSVGPIAAMIVTFLPGNRGGPVLRGPARAGRAPRARWDRAARHPQRRHCRGRRGPADLYAPRCAAAAGPRTLLHAHARADEHHLLPHDDEPGEAVPPRPCVRHAGLDRRQLGRQLSPGRRQIPSPVLPGRRRGDTPRNFIL